MKKTKKKIRVLADYSSSGIWVDIEGEGGSFRHACIDHESLNIPKKLSNDFNRWIKYYDILLDNPEKFDEFHFINRRLKLAVKLKRFLGDEFTVVYAPSDLPRKDEEITLYQV